MAAVQIYYGNGLGKTSAALGNAIKSAGTGDTVYLVQFLKGQLGADIIKRLEPEIKAFSFERSNRRFADLSDEEKTEEKKNIINGINFAKKVLTTGECDLLVLDEVLGLIDEGIITDDDLVSIIKSGMPTQKVILTGNKLTDKVREAADQVYQIVPEK